MGIKISELPAITLPFDGGEKLPIVQSGVTRASNLSSFVNFLSGALLADSELKALSGVWQSNYTTTNSNSANWNSVYTTVYGTSGSWTGGISLNTVTNYLSTNNVLLSSATILNTLSATSYVNNPTGKTIYVDSGVGTDTRTGLSKYDSFKPYRTLSAAETDSVTGDLVYVRAGTYPINSQINLNDEGNLYFEPGTTVTIANGVTGFSFNQGTNLFPSANSIRIQGAADFVLSGSAGILTMPTSTNIFSPPIVDFQCNSITGPDTANGTLFNIVNGVLSVDAKNIAMTTTFNASSARVFNITGSGRVTARVPFVYCGVFLNGAGSVNDINGNTTAQINTDIWTLITYSLSAGMTLNRVTTNFRIVNYNHTGVGVAYNWLEDTTRESHGFQGITWNGTNQPNITFTSTALTATMKLVRLYQNNILRTSAANSLSSTVPINVATYNAFAGVPATSNITLQIGSFTVDPTVNNY